MNLHFLAISILLLTSIPTYANRNLQSNESPKDTVLLQVGTPVECEIERGAIHYFQVYANTGDFVRGIIDQFETPIKIRGFFPDGTKIRSFEGPSRGAKNFRFVAEHPGLYTLELRAPETGSGKYQIIITSVQPMEERLKIIPEEKYSSPKLTELRNELARGDKQVLEKFWTEIKSNGTPLVELLQNDTAHQLVTFLWKETFKIYNVVVFWRPFTLEHPEDYKMTQLAGTDVWYKSLRIPMGARFLYQLSPNETLSRASNAQRYATVQCDPLNPRRMPDDPNLTRYEIFSIAELPSAPLQEWAAKKPNTPAGKVEKHRFKSAVLNNERDIAIYTPFGYVTSGKPYNLLVLFDGQTYRTSIPAPTTLDNLITSGKIAPLVAVLIDPAHPNVREQEYVCNPQFAAFLEKELLPWVREKYNVTRDRTHVTVGGLSAGGLAATYVAMKNPELYSNVLAQSGMFWWSPARENGEEPNWIARQFVKLPRLSLRFYLDAGIFEKDVSGSGGQILEASRHLRDVLRAKGYEVHYQEFVGGHDRLSWRGTLADGLLRLLGTR